MTERTPREQRLWDEQRAGRRTLRIPLLEEYWDEAITSAKIPVPLRISYGFFPNSDDTQLHLATGNPQVNVFSIRVTFDETNPWRIYDTVLNDDGLSSSRARWANPPVLPELMLAHIALLSDTSKGNK